MEIAVKDTRRGADSRVCERVVIIEEYIVFCSRPVLALGRFGGGDGFNRKIAETEESRDFKIYALFLAAHTIVAFSTLSFAFRIPIRLFRHLLSSLHKVERKKDISSGRSVT